MFPKIIHFVFLDFGNPMPQHWKENINTWKHSHPNFEIMLWDDNSSIKLLNQYFPEYIKLYNSFKYPIQRADFIRYCILYVYGGVYCDLDIIPKQNRNIYNLINLYFSDNRIQVLIPTTPNDTIANNNFMISQKKSLFWIDVIKEIKSRSMNYYPTKKLSVLYITGPRVLDTVYNNHKNSSPNSIYKIPYQILNPCDSCNRCSGDFGYITDQYANSWFEESSFTHFIFCNKRYIIYFIIILISSILLVKKMKNI